MPDQQDLRVTQPADVFNRDTLHRAKGNPIYMQAVIGLENDEGEAAVGRFASIHDLHGMFPVR